MLVKWRGPAALRLAWSEPDALGLNGLHVLAWN